LLKKYWGEVRSGKLRAQPQQGHGSFHRSSDSQKYKYLLTRGWDTPILEIQGKAL